MRPVADEADLKELALSVSTDPDHRFDLAISLNDLETALSLVRALPEAGSQSKWKVVGDKALEAWQLDLAQESFEKANDLPALLLLYTSLSDRNGLEKLAKLALSIGSNNIAFASFLQLGDSEACINLLADTGRLPEAALFARSYNPAKAGPIVSQWKSELESDGREKVAATIGDPQHDAELFPELEGSGSGANGSSAHETAMDVDKAEEEGSGVLVEKEDAEPQVAAASEDDASANGGLKEKVESVVEDVKDKVKEPVEGLVDKVKDLAVGGE